MDDDLSYIERPIVLLERETKNFCNKVFSLVRVQWKHRKGSNWTWEPDEEMCEH